MDRRKFLATAAAMPAAMTLGAKLARAEDHLKWAVFTPDSEVTFRTVMKPFAETVQRETANAIVFDLFPNGALGRNPGQQPQMLLDGVADVAWVIPSYSPGQFPDTEVIELPGMFKDLREASLVTTALMAHKALNDYGDYYVIGLWGTAPYSIHTNFPVNSIADLKGKTIRASSKTESAALRAFGAVPMGMPVTEIPEAISRGTIGGTTSHMAPFFDFGLDRVTNNHFFIGLGVVPLAILMNKKKFDALPQSARAVIERQRRSIADQNVDQLHHQLQRGQSGKAEKQSQEPRRVPVSGRDRQGPSVAGAGARGMGRSERAAQRTEGRRRRRTRRRAQGREGLRSRRASSASRRHHHSFSYRRLFSNSTCRADAGAEVTRMGWIDWASRTLARALAVVGLGVLLSFAVMTMADGILRFFFASPIDVVRDANSLVAAFSVACCIPVAIVERSKITIRFLPTLFGWRAGQVADAAAAILVEIVLILMTWQFVLFAQQAIANGSATWMLRIPTAPVWGAVALILGISALLQAAVAFKTLRGDYLAEVSPAVD